MATTTIGMNALFTLHMLAYLKFLVIVLVVFIPIYMFVRFLFKRGILGV